MSIPTLGPDLLRMAPDDRQVLDVIGSDLVGVQQALGGLEGNLLVNGSMIYASRMLVPGFTNTFTGNGTISADRWQNAVSGTSQMVVTADLGAPTDSVVALPRPAERFVRIQFTHGNAPGYFMQVVEDGSRWAGQKVSLTAWVDADRANFARLFMDFGTQKIYSPYHPGTYLSGSPTWRRLELTGTLPSNANMLHAGLQVDRVSGSAFFTAAMLIQGSQPVDYVARPRWMERCAIERYYEMHGGYAAAYPYVQGDNADTAGRAGVLSIPWRQRKGDTLTATVLGSWSMGNAQGAAPTMIAFSPFGFSLRILSAAAGYFNAAPNAAAGGHNFGCVVGEWNPPATDF